MENSARCFEWRKAEVARRGIDPSEKCAYYNNGDCNSL